jgi:hypothetical protein
MAQAQRSDADPSGGCCALDGCRGRATHRLALTIGRRLAPPVLLCAAHADALRRRDWALSVEDHWGAPDIGVRRSRITGARRA